MHELFMEPFFFFDICEVFYFERTKHTFRLELITPPQCSKYQVLADRSIHWNRPDIIVCFRYLYSVEHFVHVPGISFTILNPLR